MGRTVTLGDLAYTDVPDNVSDEQVRARAIYEGDLPDPGGTAEQFLIGMGKWYADRSGGRIANDVAAPEGLAAALGGIAPAAVAGFAGGASVPAQALIGATLERFREGSTVGSTLGSGAVSGAVTGGFNMAGRVLQGALAQSRAVKALRPLTSQAQGGLEQVAARTAAGAGGFDIAEQINQEILKKTAQRAMGLPGVADDLSEAVMAQARAGISQVYDAALPTGPVNVAAAKALLQQIPKEAGPAVDDVLKILDGAPGGLEPLGWQRVHSALREFRPALARSLYATWAPKLDDVLTELDTAAAAAGGDRALLGVANQQYKVMSILEEINAVAETNGKLLPAGQLVRKLGAKGWYGFGKRATVEGRTAGLRPDTQRLIQTAKLLSEEGRNLATGSATASRAFLFGPAAVAVGGYSTGQLDEKEAALLAAGGLAPRAVGTALLAPPVKAAVSGVLGQIAGEAVNP